MLSVSEASKYIRAYAQHPAFDLALTYHAKQRMQKRGINSQDVMHILMCGNISADIEASSQSGLFKCKICGHTPSSGSRKACLVVVPSASRPAVKVVTVMWEDLT